MSRIVQNRPTDNNIFGGNAQQEPQQAASRYSGKGNQSSFSFGDEPQQKKENVPAQLVALSCHDGRGGTSSGKASTKVHAPPGGRSSFSLGGYPDEAPAPVRQQQQPQQQQQQQPDAYQPNNRYSGKGNQSSFSFGDEKPQVAPASASGGRAQSSQQHSQQQSQLQQQLHTQQNQWDRPQQQQQQPQLGALSCHDGRGGMSSGKPSTKVHAPPGGKSSFSFY